MWTRNERWAAVAALAILAIAHARADGPVNPAAPVDLSSYAKQSDLTTLQSTVMSAMPQPANVAPSTDSTAPAIGSATTRYMLQDSVRPARYRSGSCAIAGGNGQCTITWSTAFSVTPNPLGDPSAINSTNFATLQYNCNWISVSTTQGVVQCRASILSLAILGSIWSLLGNGTTVYGTAVQPL